MPFINMLYLLLGFAGYWGYTIIIEGLKHRKTYDGFLNSCLEFIATNAQCIMESLGVFGTMVFGGYTLPDSLTFANSPAWAPIVMSGYMAASVYGKARIKV